MGREQLSSTTGIDEEIFVSMDEEVNLFVEM